MLTIISVKSEEVWYSFPLKLTVLISIFNYFFFNKSYFAPPRNHYEEAALVVSINFILDSECSDGFIGFTIIFFIIYEDTF